MSRPIKITEEIKKKAIEEFAEKLMKLKMADGKIEYTKNFKWDKSEKAIVSFGIPAFAKMIRLVQGFDSEVAWHGIARRDETNKNLFHIDDIIVYPQLVTGANVDTDEIEYAKWLYSFEPEVFNNIRMQGHSHVNMGVTPSGTDLGHQSEILKQLEDDMFYIFMIWNKRMERTIKIYDLENNTLFENADVDVVIAQSGIDLDAFMAEAKAVVKPRYQYGSQSGKVVKSVADAKPTTAASQQKPKSQPTAIGRGWAGAHASDGGYWGDDYYGSLYGQ